MSSNFRFINGFARALIFALCSYGLLYYAYKYYQPYFGGHDFTAYYQMYLNPWHNDAPDPFRFRKISAALTFLIYKSGIYYPNEIAFHNSHYSQRVFFAAIFSNYLALLGTVFICSYSLQSRGASPMLSGLLVLLGFGTQAFVLTGLTEGWSWFLVALGFWFYTQQKFWGLWVVLLLSAFQRETIIVIFGSFALLDAIFQSGSERKRYLQTILVALAAFGVYVLLRTFDSLPGIYTHQLNVLLMWHQLSHFVLKPAFLFQAILSQNLVFLLLLVALMLRIAKQQRPEYFWHLVATVIILVVGGIATKIENNTGRILTVLTPILAPSISSGLARLKL